MAEIILPSDRVTAFMRIFITVALICIYAMVIYTLMYRPVTLSEAVGNLFLVLIGILTREISTVVQFNFSEPPGSQVKDRTIQQQATASVVRATTAAASVTPNVNEEAKAWDEAVAENTKAVLEAYIQKFPAGSHVVEANGRIAALSNP